MRVCLVICIIDGCDRHGGQKITLIGTNFGRAGATVLIGSDSCKTTNKDNTSRAWYMYIIWCIGLSPTHDSITPHNKLTCILPAGNREDRAVVLLQKNGAVAGGASVSYAQCLPGTPT